MIVTTSAVGSSASPSSAEVQAAGQSQPSYENPVTSGLARDPYIRKVGDTYYAYLGGFDYFVPFPVRVLTSSDLVSWTPGPNVLPIEDAGGWVDTSSGWNFRSPSVLHVPGNSGASQFVLYFTAKHNSTGTDCIGVATAGSPEGPFVGEDQPLICPPGGAQDPSPVPLGDDPPYQQLVYRNNGDGAIYNRVLTPDGLSVDPGLAPYRLLDASPTWWHNGIVDRPAVTVDGDNRIYLFVSGGTRETSERAVGWSPCRQFGGVVVGCDRTTRLGTWLDSTSGVDAPSSVQVFRDGAHQWITYHARQGGVCGPQDCSGQDQLRIDKLCFKHGYPRTNGPSATPQPLDRHADCSTDIPGAAVSVDNVADDYVLSQPSNVVYRDGGGSVALGGQMLWMYSDTIMRGGCPHPTNTASLGVPHQDATGPAWATEPLDANGCVSQFIPYTQEEQTFNDTNPDGWRIALWELGGVPLPNGDALVFFMKIRDRRCSLCWDHLGTGAVRVPAGSTVADRSSSVSPAACNPTCLFDETVANHQWPFVVGDHVYALVDRQYLARAPLDDAEDRNMWRYWTGAAGEPWSDDPAAMVTVPGLKEDGLDCGGRVLDYNPYLDRFVNVTCEYGFSGWSRLTIQVAEAPEGPWTAKEFIYDAAVNACLDAEGEIRTPYGMQHAPELNMGNGRVLHVTYARPPGPGCPGQVRMVAVTLE